MKEVCLKQDHIDLPEGWRVLPLQETCREPITYGIVQCGPHVIGGVPYIRVSDMNEPELDVTSMLCTTSAIASRFSRSTVEDGDLVYALRGKLGEVRKVGPAVSGANLTQGTARLAPRRDVVTDYLLWAMRSPAVLRQAELVAKGSTFVELTLSNLRQLEITLPHEQEQRAIATALSDVDALIAGLERLIAKKRDIKQATMQQLLTGQTRLPGFGGEWEVKTLKDIAEISAGINKPLSAMGSGALYVTVQDLYDGTSIRTDRLSRIRVSQPEIEAKGLAAGDIVFGKSSVKRDGIGYPSIFLGCAEAAVFSGFTYRARARCDCVDASFLFYALRSAGTRRWLIDNAQASALTNINQRIADAIPIQVPPTISEQTAIATVLSDMDADLVALEARHAKTRAIKQGMMQELLTGRTRLV